MSLFGKPTLGEYSESSKATSSLEQGAEENEIARRMRLSEDVNMCLDGCIDRMVIEVIEAAHDKGEAAKLITQTGISTRLNLMRDALNKVDKSWAEGAEYSLAGEGVGEDGGGEVFQRHVERAHLDPVAKECSQAMWVHPGFAAMPMVIDGEEEGDPRRFVTRLFTPDRFNVQAEDGAPGVVRCVELFSFNRRSDKPFEKLKVDRVTWEKYVRKSPTEKWEHAGEGEHGYGVIPVALARPVPFRLWADNYGAQLLEATVRVNAAQTLLTHNGFSQVKALVGSFQKAPATQVLKQGALIDAPQGATLQDFQTDQAAFRAAHIDGERRMVAALFGFPADEFDGTTVPQSGEALKIRMFAAMQMAAKRREWLTRFVTDLYWIGLQVLATHMMEPGKPPIEGYERGMADLPPFVGSTPEKPITSYAQQPVRLVVKPREVVLPQLASEVAAQEDREIELGLTSVVALYLKRNPGSTPEEAATVIAANKRGNAAQPAVSPLGVRRPMFAPKAVPNG